MYRVKLHLLTKNNENILTFERIILHVLFGAKREMNIELDVEEVRRRGEYSLNRSTEKSNYITLFRNTL